MDSKHVCKFCRKSFPCGRSLGGHIRSHLIHNSNINSGNAASKEEPKLPKLGSEPGYELRENPKKTNKATDLSFMSSSPSSWSTKSDTEYGSDPNPTKRSSFHGGNNSNSSISEVVEPEQEEVAVAMSLIMLSRDVGKKSEDVSSKNVSLRQAKSRGKRRRREKIQEKCSVSGADSKKYIKKSEILGVSASGFLQNGSKEKESEVSEIGFFSSDQSNKPLESKNSVSGAADGSAKRKEKIELAAPGQIQNGSKLKEFEVIQNGFGSNDQITKPAERKRKINDPNSMTHKLGSSASGSVKNRSKMKEIEVSENGSASNDEKNNQTELGLDDIAMSSELLSNNDNYKRSKFECTTCNKIFYSYQALGGHRASHKKLISIKPSPHSKLEWNDKDFLSPPPLPTDNHHQQQQFGEIGIGSSSSTSTPIKAVQKHECPICFRIFPSGQALGGHKRSHMLSANTSSNDINKDIDVIDRSSSSETREFLDLNLPPASGEQEATIPTSSSSNNLVGLIKPHWWVEGTNKHQLLLGLISN